MPLHPSNLPIVQTNHATVGGSADAKEQPAVARPHDDVREAVISLRRQPGDNGCVRSIHPKSCNLTEPSSIAMGDVKLPAGKRHSADRAIDPKARREKIQPRHAPADRINVKLRSVAP